MKIQTIGMTLVTYKMVRNAEKSASGLQNNTRAETTDTPPSQIPTSNRYTVLQGRNNTVSQKPTYTKPTQTVVAGNLSNHHQTMAKLRQDLR